MRTATVFQSGPSTQAIRIPKDFRLPTNTKTVWIKKVGESLVLTPKPDSWEDFFKKVPQVTQDFDMSRDKSKPQKRKDFEE